jgi:hypothetical protein
MAAEPEREKKARDSAGLCARCTHVQIVVSERGSEFVLCRLSATDPRFPKYPRLPIIACDGYEATQTS